MFRLLFVFIIVFSSLGWASDIETCKAISQPEERLACYDEYHQYASQGLTNDSENTTDSVEVKIVGSNLEVEIVDSSSLFKPGTEILKREEYLLMAHRQSYFLPVSYTKNRRNLDNTPGFEVGDDASFDDLEVKFQVSLKLNLWDEILGSNSQLMAAYTQKSFWQMYNAELSSLFRETNYEPEVFINKDLSYDFLGFNLSSAQLGFVHQSNGRSQLLSRSWNRVYGNFVLQKDNFALSVKPWYRIREDYEDDDNPDIQDYLGKYELGMFYRWRGSEFTALIRNLSAKEHSASYQVGWQIPISKDINFYIEYFNGYGESLIDYNYRNETVGMGFTVGNWAR